MPPRRLPARQAAVDGLSRIRPLGSLLLAVWMAVITFAYSLVALVIWPFPLPVRHKVIGSWNNCIIWGARLLCGLSWRVEGGERMPSPPYVILSNHQSAWETIGYHAVFPRLTFVMKRSLLFIPCFGWGVAAMGPIIIDRSHRRESLKRILEQGRARIDAGFSIMIFPEGTRKPPGVRADFNKGGAWVAKKLGVHVLPVAVNSGLYWPRNSFLKRSGCIAVSVGEPIPTEALGPEEITRRAQSWIQGEQDRLEGGAQPRKSGGTPD